MSPSQLSPLALSAGSRTERWLALGFNTFCFKNENLLMKTQALHIGWLTTSILKH